MVAEVDGEASQQDQFSQLGLNHYLSSIYVLVAGLSVAQIMYSLKYVY